MILLVLDDPDRLEELMARIPAWSEANVAYQVYSYKNEHRVLVVYNARRMVDFLEKGQLNPNASGEEGLLLLLPHPLLVEAGEHGVEELDEGVDLRRAGLQEAGPELARPQELGTVAKGLHRRGEPPHEDGPGHEREREGRLGGDEVDGPRQEERDGEGGERGVEEGEVDEGPGLPAHAPIPYFSRRR